MATPAPTSTPTPPPTPSQPPVEMLYALPIGAVVPWYPPPTAYLADPDDAKAPKTLVFPPGFAMCDGKTVTDPESPFNGMTLPNLLNRMALGTDGTIPAGQEGGDPAFNVRGWLNPMILTLSTVAGPQDNQGNSIIQHNSPTQSWRYTLTQNDVGMNDGNHHHYVPENSFGVPAPGYVAFLMIIRIK